MRPAALALVCTIGCAGSPGPGADEPSASDLDEQALGSPSTSQADDEPTRQPAAEPTLNRVELDHVLDGGPGAFLARVEVAPHFDGRRFAGWQLVGYRNTGSKLAQSGLLPGDVVVSVNEHSLERPEHLAKLWKALRSANDIRVSGLRSGKPFELSFPVSSSGG